MTIETTKFEEINSEASYTIIMIETNEDKNSDVMYGLFENGQDFKNEENHNYEWFVKNAIYASYSLQGVSQEMVDYIDGFK